MSLPPFVRSTKATVPDGVPDPAVGATVAVKVIGWPSGLGSCGGFAVTVIVVAVVAPAVLTGRCRGLLAAIEIVVAAIKGDDVVTAGGQR